MCGVQFLGKNRMRPVGMSLGMNDRTHRGKLLRGLLNAVPWNVRIGIA